MVDAEIIAQVTQFQYDTSDVTEGDNGDEGEHVEWEISSPRKGETRQAFEVLRSCCLFQDDGEKMRRKVSDTEKCMKCH